MSDGRHYLFGGDEPATGKGSGVSNWAVIGIFLILLFAAVAAARDFLMPVTLAILLFFVFTPLRRYAGRRGIPDTLTALVVCLGVLLSIGGLILIASGPANEAIQNYPAIADALRQKLAFLKDAVRNVQDVAVEIDGSGAALPTAAEGQVVAVTDQSSATMSALQGMAISTPFLLGQFALVMFLLFFMMASGDLLYLKIVQSFDKMKDKRAAYLALREIEASLGNYLSAITFINLGLGIAVGAAMWLWGMPTPILFGIAAFVLNFIPFLGSIAGIAAAGLVALVVFDDLYMPLLVAGSYFVLMAIEGQVITPYFVSKRLKMNIVVVFLSVTLWAWLWSVIGMVIAVPVLVVVRVLSEHIQSWEKFGNFLEGDEPLPLEEQE
ncbi:AI-2E family transporter [Pseudogemmobacter bohemicus]|uniref:AI-2E family transporter n=1 Tax=Pseudogemmobacter bohemicus TaxID=2250708 RepID=UPI0013006629|nr:AI-2E family transporter [Pseudogemmobacter bohemicus]